MPQALQIAGVRVAGQHSSPLGVLTVVENQTIPFREAPGLSLLASEEPPPQIAVFTDADAMTVITRDAGDPAVFAYLDQTPSALPYHLAPIASALILGAGGGADVLQAKYHDVSRITAVELNPQLVELLRGPYAAFSGRLYDNDRVEVNIADIRGFVATTSDRYDLIQLPPLDAFGTAATGLQALNENYIYTIYTVEAIDGYLERLSDNGYLSISRWIRIPPRESLKLLNMAATALRQRGIDTPGRHIMMIRGWQLATLLLKPTPFTAAEVERLRRFARQRAFDLVWYPGMTREEANRFNRLDGPIFHDAARQLLGARPDTFLARYKFDLTPATDDRPFFHHSFRWRTASEILALRKQGGMGLIEQTYLVLIATLLQAFTASAVLILFPLTAFRRQRRSLEPKGIVLYFSAIGLAFLFIEIGFIQKFTLILHHPILSAATVITTFLVAAGIGSLYSRRLTAAASPERRITPIVSAILLTAITLHIVSTALANPLLELPLALRIGATIVLIAPLAFFMGMPFPLALSTLHDRRLISWAWGINGCASVIAAVLATLVAMSAGFTTVLIIASMLYVLAAWRFPTTNGQNEAESDVTRRRP